MTPDMHFIICMVVLELRNPRFWGSQRTFTSQSIVVLLANLPDIDIVPWFLLGTSHRTWSHSFLSLFDLGALTFAIGSYFLALVTLCWFIHILADLWTTHGVQTAWPVSRKFYTFGVMGSVEPELSLVCGLIWNGTRWLESSWGPFAIIAVLAGFFTYRAFILTFIVGSHRLQMPPNAWVEPGTWKVLQLENDQVVDITKNTPLARHAKSPGLFHAAMPGRATRSEVRWAYRDVRIVPGAVYIFSGLMLPCLSHQEQRKKWLAVAAFNLVLWCLI